MGWLRSLIIGLLGVIGGILGNLIAAIVEGSLGQITLLQVGAMIAGIFLAVALTVTIQQRWPIDSTEQIRELKQHRLELYRLKGLYDSGVPWTSSGVNAWLDHQNAIAEIKDRLRDRDIDIPYNRIDEFPPPKLGCLTRIIEFTKRNSIIMAFPILFGLALFLSPKAQYCYVNYVATPTPTITPIPTSTDTPTTAPTDTPTKSPSNSELFSAYPNYDPSGYMGDSGDVTVEKGPEVVRFIYEIKGRGPHEFENKYLNGELNPEPAQFAGVMYLNPLSNWGEDANGGFDLRRFRRVIKWEARSLEGEVNVEFVIGGVVWKWDDEKKERVAVPYPDSMPRVSLGIKTLTENWQSFKYDLFDKPEDHFRRVVGGFGWVISWSLNQVQMNDARTGPEKPKTFTIEIRNIRYER